MKLLTPLFIVIIVIGGFIFYVNPTYGEIKTLQVQAEQYDNALADVKQARTLLEQKQNEYNSIPSEDLKKLNTLLPDSIDNIKLLVNINDIAQGYGTEIQGVRVETVSDGPGKALGPDSKSYSSLKVGFSITTTYDVLMEFLKDLQRSVRLVDLQTMAFQATDSGLYSFTVSFKTYWLK